MSSMKIAAIVAAALLLAPGLPAQADNQMGYRLLSPQQAAGLPHNQGALGLDVERGQQISDSGLTFSIIRVKQVRGNSAGAQAGFRVGDQIIALDGYVFPTLSAFAAYIGSIPPGSEIAVDYMPAGTGPQQAERLTVIVGQAGRTSSTNAPPSAEPPRQGLSTGTKIAIGAGAIALFGCYKMGCFSQHGGSAQPAPLPSGW